MHNVKRRYPSRSMQVRIMYIMLNMVSLFLRYEFLSFRNLPMNQSVAKV